MMNLFKRVCSIVLVVALIVTVFAVAIYTGTSAEGGSGTGKTEPKYGLSIGNRSLTEEEEGTVNISLSGSGVYGVYFELVFDNTAVTLSDMNLNDALDSSKYHISSKDNDGVFKVAIYSKEEIPAGNIASVNVTAEKITDEQLYSSLELQNVVLSDSAFSRIDSNEIKLTNGEVRVFPTGTEKLSFVSNALSLSDAVSIITKIPNSLKNDYSGIYLTYKYEDSPVYDEERKVYATKENGQDKVVISSGIECIQFEFSNIRPDHYARNIKIVVHAKLNGYDYCSTPLGYSVAQYCANKFSSSSTKTELKKLCAYILKYGAAAQQYVESKDSKMDTGILCDQLSNVKSGVKDYGSSIKDSDIDYKAISNSEYFPFASTEKEEENFENKIKSFTPGLLLESSISYRLKFEMPEGYDVSTIKVKTFNEKLNLKNTYTGNKIVKFAPDDDNDKTYYIDCPGYNPASMTLPIYFRLFDENDKAISYTFKYSVSTYAYKKSQTDNELGRMCIAMMKYGMAVEEYADAK